MEPKKGLKNTIIGILVAVLALMGYNAGTETFGAINSRANAIPYLISTATSTGSYGAGNMAVKILDKSSSRRYVHIQNNSDTAMFLYATTTELVLTGEDVVGRATTSIPALNGIYLAPTDGDNTDDTYIIDQDNMIYGHLYASSTAGATKKELLINYYQ